MRGDEPSFDPRTWSRAPAAAAPTPPAPPPPPPTGLKPPRTPGMLAALTCVLTLIGGALASWSARHPAAGAPTATVAEQVAAPSGPAASRRTLVIGGAGDLAATLAATGVAPADAHAATTAAMPALGGAGDVRLVLDLVGDAAPYRLTRLEATLPDGSGTDLMARAGGGYGEQRLAARLTTRVKVVRGEMDATSFYNAAVTAGITDSLIADFANAFAFDFDFQREIHPGDVFEAAFSEKVNPEGHTVGDPTLLYASITTPAKSRALYRFLPPGDTQPGWFDGNGHSSVRALMRTPVDGARISSQFGMRLHPVLGFMKLHTGTDFAAPIGTAIFAAGDGVVEWAAMKGPNGNLTILRHDNGWETYYLHQSRFMPGIAPGARVHQGQEIGEIGTTGRSTGPHLHYELHIGGKPVNPLGVDYGTGRSLTGGALAAFVKERNQTDAARAHPAL